MRLLAAVTRRVRNAEKMRRIAAAASVRERIEGQAERVADVPLPSSSMLPGAGARPGRNALRKV